VDWVPDRLIQDLGNSSRGPHVLEEQGSEFHILAAIGDQVQQSALLPLACTLAQSSGQGVVTLLCITPDGVRPEWLVTPERCETLAVHVEIRAGEDAGHLILEALRDLEPDLLLLGWSGEEGSRRYLLGSTLDPVTRYAPCHVVVARASGLGPVQRVLVPMAGGPNAGLAVELALRLSPDAQVTALNIVREATGSLGVAAGREQLTRALEPWEGNPRIAAQVVRASGVIDGILSEAAQGYDALLIGASNESYIDRSLFGSVPQAVAAKASMPTLIVRRRAGPLKSALRQAERVLSGVQDYMTTAERVEAYREIRRGARPRLDFFVLIGFAAAIAALGLLMNSPAVIIGAMLIAPLMSAIFGTSLGMVQGDGRLLWQAAGTVFRGAGLAIIIGMLIGLIVPLDAPTDEILSYAQPTLLDLVLALVSGAAGAYAQCRRNVLGALAGVGIAVSLVPPLATTGVGLVSSSATIAGGALLMFLTNLVAITAAGSIVFLLFGFRPDPGKRVRLFGRWMGGVLALLVVVSILLTVLTVRTIRENRLHYSLQTALAGEVAQIPGVELSGWKVTDTEGKTMNVEVVVRAVRPISYQEAVALQERVAARLGQPLALVLSVTNVTRLDPHIPPTPTIVVGDTY
jgi:uncharacterized hydrophobic protein (TIGR00271 family)